MRIVPTAIVVAAVCLLTIGFKLEGSGRAERLVVDHVNIIDVVTGEVARDRSILIEDGVVRAIEPAGFDHGRAHLVNGADRYVVPGLWDSHVHSTGDVDDALGRTFPLFVAHGVTHVRDMASNLDRLDSVRRAIDTDQSQIAPHMLASGPLLIETELRWYGDIQRAVGEPGQPEAAVADLADAGVQFLKAYTGLSADSYEALMDAAGERGLAVDGHVPDSVGLVGVVDAGQRTIEHLDMSAFLTCAGGPDGPFGNHIAVRFNVGMEAHMRNIDRFWRSVDWEVCGSALQRFGARGGALTPTLSMEIRDRARLPEASLSSLSDASRAWCLQGLDELDAVPIEVREAAYAAVRDALMRVHSLGVTILAGTDAPNHCTVPGISLAVELEHLHEAGLSPLQVLQSATLNPASVFGQETGVRPGRRADFILLDANPLQDITAYRAPSSIVIGRRVFDRAMLESLRAAGRTERQAQ